jgi:putative hydrolase of the HAD superfamily
MADAPIKAIIFDLGNVLVDFDHTIAAKRISLYCNKNDQEIYDLIFYSPETILFEEGKISAQDFYQRVSKRLGLNLEFNTFVSIWNEIFFLSAKNRQVLELASGLRQHYRLGVITNINCLHFDYLKNNFDILKTFDVLFTSFELGVIKPKQEIYKKMLGALGTRPQEVFYTDDREELIQSARALGINGHVFKDIAGLKRDLSLAGVAINFS